MRGRQAGGSAGPLVALLVVVVVVLSGCSRGGSEGGGVQAQAATPGAIRVGAFDFPESRLLAELYGQALKAAGFPVAPVVQLGSREIVEPALEQGRIDVVPEYTGSALVFLRRDPAAADDDVARTHEELVRAFGERGIRVGAAAPAQNQNAFVVTEGTASQRGLRKVSDLAAVADDLVVGGPPECPQRHTCLAGLRNVYGIEFQRFLSLTPTSHVAAAVAAGEIDVGLLFTTDPAILVNDFVVLEDDRGLQPAENVVPVVREAVVQRHGAGVMEALDEVSSELTTLWLARLNLDMAKRGQPVEDAAASWLGQQVVKP